MIPVAVTGDSITQIFAGFIGSLTVEYRKKYSQVA